MGPLNFRISFSYFLLHYIYLSTVQMMYDQNVLLIHSSSRWHWLVSASVSDCAGQYEPDQVRCLKGCAKTSPGLRVTDSFGPRTEERTSSSTSRSESAHFHTRRWVLIFEFFSLQGRETRPLSTLAQIRLKKKTAPNPKLNDIILRIWFFIYIYIYYLPINRDSYCIIEIVKTLSGFWIWKAFIHGGNNQL